MRRILFRIVCQAPRYSNCIRLYTNSGHAEIVKKINQAYSKIDEYNTQINAFVSVRDRRDVLVRVASEGGYDISKPLSGQLVAIKDNFATRSVGSDCQSERTTCGSGILRDYHSPISATVVSLIENSGGIVLGKTNMDEFGMGSLGTFSIHGATINPTVGNGRRPGSDGSAHSAGGSSGGSAAAVASFMCDVALGSDTGGSVRLPATWCGIVGFKPTYGRCSRYGLVPYASSLDTVGILARSVGDVRTTYDVIAQPDFRDMTCMSGEFRAFIGDLIKKRTWIGASLSCPEKKSPLRGVTVGIPIEYWVDELADRVRDAWREAAVRLASLGADIVQVSLPSTRHALPAYYIIAPAEASTNLARYDGIRYGHRTEPEHQGESVGEEFMTTRKEGFGEEVQRRILLGTHSLTTGTYEGYYLKAQKIRRLVQHDFDRIFALPNSLSADPGLVADRETLVKRDGRVDILLAPTATSGPPQIPVSSPSSKCQSNSGQQAADENPAGAYVNDVMTVPASLAGLPAITVPWKKSDGPSTSHTTHYPVGLQILGQYGDDDLVLCIAAQLFSV